MKSALHYIAGQQFLNRFFVREKVRANIARSFRRNITVYRHTFISMSSERCVAKVQFCNWVREIVHINKFGALLKLFC